MMNFYIGDCRGKNRKIAALPPFLSFLIPAVLFLLLFALCGPGVYNDSDQYIKMHIHREPLYPLFLLALRSIFGDSWLIAMGVIQNLLAAACIGLFCRCLARQFGLKCWQELIVMTICLVPHFMTMLFSSLHLFMTNSVMSEALCLPLFTLFVAKCLQMLLSDSRKDIWLALILALLLSLTRNQMLLALLMWALVWGAAIVKRGFYEKQKAGKILLRLGAVLLLTILVFGIKGLAVRSYNYVFNGHFIPNTYGSVNTLTNILYAADREDAEGIADQEAREFFYRMYDLTEENKANYHYAGDTIKEKAEHIESWHDTIKYQMIEDVFYQTYDQTVTSDYITQNLMADEAASKMIAGVLPACIGRWLGNYLILASYGLIRSIAVVHPLLSPAAVCIYLAAGGLMFINAWNSRKKTGKCAGSVWFMGIALIAIFANAFAVSITIMALSRYMIYGFAPFYCALFCLVVEWFRGRSHESKKIA